MLLRQTRSSRRPPDGASPHGSRTALSVATSAGYLKGALLETPDLEEAWLRYAPSFYGDAVRNFNAYPEYCLAGTATYPVGVVGGLAYACKDIFIRICEEEGVRVGGFLPEPI